MPKACIIHTATACSMREKLLAFFHEFTSINRIPLRIWATSNNFFAGL